MEPGTETAHLKHAEVFWVTAMRTLKHILINDF